MLYLFLKTSIIGFQSPATPIMEGIIDLHNYIFFYLILVFVFVLWMYFYIIYNYYIVPTFLYDETLNLRFYHLNDFFEENFGTYAYDFFFSRRVRDGYEERRDKANVVDELRIFFADAFIVVKLGIKTLVHNRFHEILVTRKIVHGTLIEIIWTIIPSIILVLIAVPSFALLYSMDEIADPKLTVKAIGYQWFWTYEYSQDFDVIEFDYLKDSLSYSTRYYRDSLVYDSVMLSEKDLEYGYHRLLDVDHQMILPSNVHIRLMVTAGDVLHSWAVPSLGVKIDAVPGRMSQVGLFIKHQGVFYGQCSELCGVNHGFMPIVVKVVSYDNFLSWYRSTELVWN